jgi:cephalosporin hydroxylase
MIHIDLNNDILKKQVNLEIPENKWIHKWGIDNINAQFIYNMIINSKPKIIIETGTFEGQGTYVLAQAAHQNNNNAKIYTIDYDGDPTSSTISHQQWLDLKKIRNDNLNRIKIEFPNVEVIFLDGDSREMLPKIFDEYGEQNCDFFYQDSMHFIEGIQQEWNLVRSQLSQNSITIFDDLKLKGVQRFKDWFIKNESGYNLFELNNGHRQFIVSKQ